MRFQFQNGAIASIFHVVILRLQVLFQFQNGAIASDYKMRIYAAKKYVSIPKWCDCKPALQMPAPNWLSSFNSKMVRLQAVVGGNVQYNFRRFNSKMVRLQA